MNSERELQSSKQALRDRQLATAATIFVAIALVVGFIGGVYRAVNGRPDWDDLQIETRYVWEHKRTAPNTAMFGYLPTTTFALWPFTTWLPTPVGATLFALSNVACAIASLWLLKRYWIPESVAMPAYALAAALIAVNLAHAVQANQTTLWTLFLCVAGLTLAFRTRPFGGGLLLGLAALIKTMPVMLVGLLVLRGKWRSLLGVAVAVVAFNLLPSVAFFGVDGAIREHRDWFTRAGWHGNRHMIDEPMLRIHRHGNNSAYSAVLTRWLREQVPVGVTDQLIIYGDAPDAIVAGFEAARAPHEIITRDPMPARDGGWMTKRVSLGWVPRWHLTEFSADAVWWIWVATVGVGLLLLVALTLRARTGASFPWPAVTSLWLLAMFWPSPMMRHYYLAWALPALFVICAALIGAEREPKSDRESRPALWLPRAAILLWIVGVACIGWRVARWYGIHLAALAMLGIAVVWVVLGLIRKRDVDFETGPTLPTTE